MKLINIWTDALLSWKQLLKTLLVPTRCELRVPLNIQNLQRLQSNRRPRTWNDLTQINCAILSWSLIIVNILNPIFDFLNIRFMLVIIQNFKNRRIFIQKLQLIFTLTSLWRIKVLSKVSQIWPVFRIHISNWI